MPRQKNGLPKFKGYETITTMAEERQKITYKLKSSKEEKYFVLKMMQHEQVERLMTELQIINKQLKHYHLIPIESILTHKWMKKKWICVISPYFELGNFNQCTTKYTLTDNQILDLFHQILSALDCLHSKNVIHGAVKAENILLRNITPNSIDVVLSDFLSSKVREPNAILSFGGEFTPPEMQLKHENAFTKKVDIWALGCFMYQLITRETIDNMFSFIKKGGIGENFVPQRLALKDVARAVSRMLSLKPNERPNAKELIDELFKDKLIRSPSGTQAKIKVETKPKKLKVSRSSSKRKFNEIRNKFIKLEEENKKLKLDVDRYKKRALELQKEKEKKEREIEKLNQSIQQTEELQNKIFEEQHARMVIEKQFKELQDIVDLNKTHFQEEDKLRFSPYARSIVELDSGDDNRRCKSPFCIDGNGNIWVVYTYHGNTEMNLYEKNEAKLMKSFSCVGETHIFSISNDDEYIACAIESDIKFFETKRGHLKKLFSYPQRVESFCMSDDDQWVICVIDKYIEIRDFITETPIMFIDHLVFDPVPNIYISPNKDEIIYGLNYGELIIFDMENKFQKDIIIFDDTYMRAFKVCQNGKIIITYYDDHIQIYNRKFNTILKIKCGTFSSFGNDENYIVVSKIDATLEIWNIHGERISTINGLGMINGLMIHDDKIIYSTNQGRTKFVKILQNE